MHVYLLVIALLLVFASIALVIISAESEWWLYTLTAGLILFLFVIFAENCYPQKNVSYYESEYDIFAMSERPEIKEQLSVKQTDSNEQYLQSETTGLNVFGHYLDEETRWTLYLKNPKEYTEKNTIIEETQKAEEYEQYNDYKVKN